MLGMMRPFYAIPRDIAAIWAALTLACGLLLASPVKAQTFPELTGRIVDAAHIIPPDEVARLDAKLATLEQQSHRQVVIATLPDLQGYEISDYGYQLGRHWGIGDKGRNDGAILIIAPKERKVRIEVGYGLEPVLTDGLSALIVQQAILPRFKAGDMPGGIEAGADAIIKQLSLPEDQARALAAKAKPKASLHGQIGPAFLWLLFILLFMVIPAIARSRRGSAYRSSGLGPIILWSALDGMGSGRGGSNWGGGGGFSGGGGSFGGGGASGGW